MSTPTDPPPTSGAARTFFEVVIDCPSCFNTVLDALRGRNDVTGVEASISRRCMRIDHVGDGTELQQLVADVGRCTVVGANGEIGLTAPEPERQHACRWANGAPAVRAGQAIR